jgi:hypothetical protein
MTQPSLSYALRVCLCSFLIYISSIHTSSAQIAGEGELMLLKNGNVLQGFIERTANHYQIQNRPGNRLIIPFEKVEMLGSSLAEIYWRRLATIGATDIERQQALFQWCLKYHLWQEAKNQIEVLQAIKPDAARISHLQRRLQQSQQSAQEMENREIAQPAISAPDENGFRPIPATGAFASEDTGAGLSLNAGANRSVAVKEIPGDQQRFFSEYEPVFEPLPPVFQSPVQNQVAANPVRTAAMAKINHVADEGVIQVGFDEEPLNDPSLSRDTVELTVHELEQFIRQQPKNSLARFRARVEPVLVAQCSDCHNNVNENPMRLLLRNKKTPPTVRMSQRNYYAAVQYLDKSNWEASSFLTMATMPHGNSDRAPISPTSIQFQALREWVQLVTQTGEQNALSTGQPELSNQARSTGSLHANSPGPTRIQQLPAAENLKAAQAQSSGEAQLSSVPPTIGEIPSLTQPIDHFVPRDEFDPEIFNRQFGLIPKGSDSDR